MRIARKAASVFQHAGALARPLLVAFPLALIVAAICLIPRAPRPALQLQEHWWQDQQLLTRVLVDAEKAYQRHVAAQEGILDQPTDFPQWERDAPPAGAPPGPSPFVFMDRWFVPQFPCPAETRLGKWGDGGKWVCLSHYPSNNSVPVVVSVGSNGDTSFEAAIFETLGAPTHTFDPTLSQETVARVSALEYVNFHSAALAGKSEVRKTRNMFRKKYGKVWVLTIPELLEQVEAPYVDILKVDCEGCERAVVKDLRALYTRETVPFGQLQFELHRCNEVQATSTLIRGLEELGFRLFHTEINPFGASFDMWQYEVAFIHERLVKPKDELLSEGLS